MDGKRRPASGSEGRQTGNGYDVNKNGARRDGVGGWSMSGWKGGCFMMGHEGGREGGGG